MSQSTDSCKAEASHHEHNIGLGEIDAETEKRLIRKIDLFLMPSMFILYLLSYMDRSNIGFAKIAGMEEDLELSSNEYYIAVVVWVIGYTAAAVPSMCAPPFMATQDI
ncbi:hypothetical protein N7530_008321 [Penicillium desertorum]|uniref:Major facilitator superfamily (MFS) profile domain-containing protein n=1 Tax=Penicillium desertorum TaxID=1303715 RepID=A0A9X0BKV6_9EURO|nr:hypothetical protein N7530_008321 [Penicillium desertorum]